MNVMGDEGMHYYNLSEEDDYANYFRMSLYNVSVDYGVYGSTNLSDMLTVGAFPLKHYIYTYRNEFPEFEKLSRDSRYLTIQSLACWMASVQGFFQRFGWSYELVQILSHFGVDNLAKSAKLLEHILKNEVKTNRQETTTSIELPFSRYIAPEVLPPVGQSIDSINWSKVLANQELHYTTMREKGKYLLKRCYQEAEDLFRPTNLPGLKRYYDLYQSSCMHFMIAEAIRNNR